jgi:uncharacterized SAM-binding protein YcdF (DUF218 family)
MDEREARDAVLAMVYTAMPLTSDAIVVLCGEDAAARLATGVEWLRQGAAPRIVLSGGVHAPPRVLSAESLASELLAMGVAPDRVIVETTSTNTRDQAVNVMAMAKENGWRRVIVVASPYHLPRAFLTFLAAVPRIRNVPQVQIVPLAAAVPRWCAPPPGGFENRSELYAQELKKIEQHQSTGDCATYMQALRYITTLEKSES